MSKLTRGGTAEPVTRNQILRRKREEGNICFPVQRTKTRVGNLTRLVHTLLYAMTIHTRSRVTQIVLTNVDVDTLMKAWLPRMLVMFTFSCLDFFFFRPYSFEYSYPIYASKLELERLLLRYDLPTTVHGKYWRNVVELTEINE